MFIAYFAWTVSVARKVKNDRNERMTKMSIDAFGRNLPNTHGKGLFVCAALFAVGAILPLSAANEVWVSDARGNDATGAGTYDSPYKTIQKGVDEVDAGGTVKIQAGTYGIGEEHFADSHTNRVLISGKSVTLDGVDGKDVTHLVGCLDPNSEYGASPAAVRCIYLADAKAVAGTIIKNLTLRDSGADSVNTKSGRPYGYGGAVSTYSGDYSESWLVDCVISNSAACMGGALLGVNALRCAIVDCTSSGFGAATRRSRLMHCLVLRNRTMNSSRPALSYSVAVNCTVALCPGTKTEGIGRSVYAHNCISFGNGASDIVATGKYSVAETNNCYVTSDDAHLLFSTANADYRVTAGTPADKGGLTTYFSKITLPAGERADIDFAGNEFDINKATCDAGCIQGAATPAGGRIVFTSPYIVEGVPNGVGGANIYYTPETWPVSVRARPIVNNITNYICANPVTGSYGASQLRRIFPLMDGSHLFTPPPSGYLSFDNVIADVVVYAKPGADAAEADGSEAHPYPTLQAAVDSVEGTAAENPLILAFPGIYNEGGKEVGGVFTRLVIPGDKYYTVRSLSGPENTVIKGAADESNTGDYAGCGPAAVRCVAINNVSGTATPSAIQGFTLADGHTRCDVTDDAESSYGGGILGMGSNDKKSQLLDCIVTNCVAVRGGASHNSTLIRCKLYDCHGYGSVLRSTRLVACYMDPSCTLGSAPADVTPGTVFGLATSTYLSTAPEATAADSSLSLYNTLFASHAPQSDNKMWGSVTTNAAAIASTMGCAYVYDANFADPANGDWRLRTTTPARYASRLPASGTSAYNTWAENFAIWVHGDIDGNPICALDGVPLPGCWQTTVGPKSAFVEAARGGLEVAGGTLGDNAVDTENFALTLTPGIGSRPCCGYTVNGETNLFADAGSGTVTAADVAAGEYGVVVMALYSTNWYVNPAGDDTLNGGSTVATPMKTLAAVMAKVQAGDTVHAAAGTYEEGSMVVSDSPSYDLATRVFVPSRVTLVSDDGPEATFIVGAPDTTATKNEYGMGANAIRCVHMGKYARVKGFTITGGYTCWDGDDYEWGGNWSGGGVFGDSGKRENVYVEDCIISNNWAMYAGGGRYVNMVRCRIFENHALLNGGALRDAHANGCVIDRNYSGTASSSVSCASCYKFTHIVGCTLGPHNYRIEGTSNAYATRLVSSSSATFHDNLVLGSTGQRGDLTNTVTGCVFADGKNGWPTDETCIVVPSSELEVDENLRPIVGRNAAVDRGSAEALSQHSGGLIPSETDALYFPRVINGKMDVGALEGDWRPMYAKLLDGKGTHLAVDEASSGVVTNDVGGVAAVELHGGEALSLTWGTAANPAVRRGFVKVAGEGTLTVTLNGAPFGAYTVTDGAAEFAVPAVGLDAFAFTFAFDGEGVADLYGFSAKIGSVLSIR